MVRTFGASAASCALLVPCASADQIAEHLVFGQVRTEEGRAVWQPVDAHSGS
ncbi:hypothetical protein [Streptomyces longisporoflavus]|uniref:hypothetical protein n=1 Tax=Streptomyces longisporoflavus TaxID=28044 RepID=UPI00167C92B8|nr:hypothetical protein [Streptomyces longisporoflavus]